MSRGEVDGIRRSLETATTELRNAMSLGRIEQGWEGRLRQAFDKLSREAEPSPGKARPGPLPPLELAEQIVSRATEALALSSDGAFLLACCDRLGGWLDWQAEDYVWGLGVPALRAFVDTLKQRIMPSVGRAIQGGACNDFVLEGRQNEVAIGHHRLAALRAGGLVLDDAFFIDADRFSPLVARGHRCLVMSGDALLLLDAERRTTSRVTTARDAIAASSLLDHSVRYPSYRREADGSVSSHDLEKTYADLETIAKPLATAWGAWDAQKRGTSGIDIRNGRTLPALCALGGPAFLMAEHVNSGHVGFISFAILFLAPMITFLGLGGLIDPRILWSIGPRRKLFPMRVRAIGACLALAGIAVSAALVFLVYRLQG